MMQIEVEVVYIRSAETIAKISLILSANATIQDAILHSNLLDTYPEVASLPVGIFGKQKPLTTILKTGDRVEIYRPLLVDPMERRRQRAFKKKRLAL